jgi:intracellular multiplication protein IcmS
MELTQALTVIAKKMDQKFTLKGSQISYEELFSPSGLLPGLAKRADQLSSLCLGYGIGMNIEDEDGALLGHKVSFDEFTPNTLRLLCIVDVLHEIVKMSPTKGEIALDELLYD